MNITIPYEYTKQIIPKRCRKPRPAQFKASISLLIHEITGDEAPVAIREHTERFSDKTDAYEPIVIEYRWWKHKLWTLYKFQRFSHAPHETQIDSQFKQDPWPMTNGRHECYKSRQKNRQELMSWAREVLFIDGVRWEQTEEPRYVINTFGLGHNHGGTSLSSTNFYNSNISKTRYFRIDQYGEALKTAIAIAERRGDSESVSYIKENSEIFDIIIPEAVRLNPNKEHGQGDPFINRLEGIIDSSPCKEIAGLMVMAEAAKIFSS